jgi:RNA polymerase sigma factor (sigma-70 family)
MFQRSAAKATGLIQRRIPRARMVIIVLPKQKQEVKLPAFVGLSPKEYSSRVSLLFDGAMLISRANTPAVVMFQGAPAKAAAASDTAATCNEDMNPDPKKIADLFVSEESALLYFAVAIVRRRSVAEELVQEAFLRLNREWGRVENPRAWLYRTVRNLALNHLRDAHAETPLDEERALPDDRQQRDQLGPSEAIGTVRMLLAEMPEEDRDLVMLKYHEELKYQEISARTGLSVGNVGFRLHNILKILLDGLQRAGIEGSDG